MPGLQDTGDNPQYTNSPYDMCQVNGNGMTDAQYQAACKIEEFRHADKFNYGFVDGHAHLIQQGMYTVFADGDNFTIMPQNPQDMINECYDPNATMEVSGDTNFGGPSGGFEDQYSCQQTVAAVVTDRVQINP